MIPYLRSLASILILLILAGCNATNSSKPSDPPASFSVVAGDGQVAISWDEQPGLQYYLFVAAANSVAVSDFSSGKSALPESRIYFPVTQYFTGADNTRIKSTYVVSGLTNGKTYSFLINATKDGGPAGPASTSITAVPRLAGASWSPGAKIPNEGLNASGSFINNTISTVLLAAGKGGAIYKSTDAGQTWSPEASNTTNTLNAIGYSSSSRVLLAVGDNGTLLTGVNNDKGGATWTGINTSTTARLNDFDDNGADQLVVVGDKGTILLSNNKGVSWAAQTSGTDKDLNSVVFTNGVYVAVGAVGTILTSTDGVTWTARSSGTSAALYSVNDNATITVAVGESGTIVSSADNTSWTAATSNTKQNLYSVAGATQFVAVGAAGTILNSVDGKSWTTATSNTSADLYDVAYESGVYLAVGANGINLTAR